MALSFILDEPLRGLHQAIARHNRRGLGLALEVVCVGDVDELPLSSPDPAILLWAEREGRIVVTLDFHTMPNHLVDHLRLGHRSPGVIVLDDSISWREMVKYLELVAHAGLPDDYQDTVRFGPQ